jgi:16S rRNA (guanine527-N7)-methyltransferase
MTLEAELGRGLAVLDLSVAAEVERKLLDYVALVAKWNRVYNLTAVRGPERMLTHHVLDSLAVVPYVGGKSIVDVGSGAGLPGIPLALALPHLEVTLVESSAKKSAFLKQAVIELDLRNVAVENIRAEAWRPDRLFDVVISRAFSDLAEFLSIARHLCAANGVLAAMKGVYPHEELHQIPDAYRVHEIKALRVPGLMAERHLVVVRPVKSEP